jgi:hypothetical protein
VRTVLLSVAIASSATYGTMWLTLDTRSQEILPWFGVTALLAFAETYGLVRAIRREALRPIVAAFLPEGLAAAFVIGTNALGPSPLPWLEGLCLAVVLGSIIGSIATAVHYALIKLRTPAAKWLWGTAAVAVGVCGHFLAVIFIVLHG